MSAKRELTHPPASPFCHYISRLMYFSAVDIVRSRHYHAKLHRKILDITIKNASRIYLLHVSALFFPLPGSIMSSICHFAHTTKKFTCSMKSFSSIFGALAHPHTHTISVCEHLLPSAKDRVRMLSAKAVLILV